MTDRKPTDDDSDDELTGEPAGAREPVSEEDRGADSGETTERRPLRRSSADRVIAGVAGGVGNYFGTDPVIVRVVFIGLTFLGGSGAFLYLLGWLALPGDNSPSIIAKALGSSSDHRFRNLAAVALIGVGLLTTATLSDDFFRLFGRLWTAAPYLAVMLIAVGLALVLWPGPARRPRSGRARPPTPLPAAPHAPDAERVQTAFSEAPQSATAAPSHASPAKRRRRRSAAGALTIGVLFIYAGAAAILGRLSVIELEIGDFFAVALGIIGIGLVIAALVGPARGLILLGLATLAPVVVFSGTDAVWASDVGEVRVTASEPDELTSDYRHGIGRLIVDLRDFDADGSISSLAISVGIGEALIYLPDNLKTITDVDVGAGDIRISARSAAVATRPRGLAQEDGIGLTRRIETSADGDLAGVLRLDVDIGIGRAELVTSTAPNAEDNR